MLNPSEPSTISGMSPVVWPTTRDDRLFSIIRISPFGNGFVLLMVFFWIGLSLTWSCLCPLRGRNSRLCVPTVVNAGGDCLVGNHRPGII